MLRFCEVVMNINDALNKICVYSSILGFGKDTDKGSLLECFDVSLYNNVNEHTDDTGRYLELDVNFVKGEKSMGHYKASYMFPKSDSSIFYGLEWDKLKSFVDVMLVAASYLSSFSVSDECSFDVLNNIIKYSEDLDSASGKTILSVK